MITYVEATTADSVTVLDGFILAQLAASGVDTAGLSDLSAERGLVALFAGAEARAEQIRAIIAKTVSIDDAVGPWLDVVCKGRFQEDRFLATKTRGRLHVNVAAAGGTQVIHAGDLRADGGGGVFFTNTQGITISPGGPGVLIDFICDSAGIVGNVDPGAIASFQRAPSGMTVINLTGWITFAGTNVETDTAYRARCKSKWARLGAGWTRSALNYLIPTLSPTITRWKIRDDSPMGPGTILIIGANAAGPATGPELALLLAGLGAADVMTLGTGGLFAVPASALVVAVTGTLYGSGANPTLLADSKAALALLASMFDIGGNGTPPALDSSLLQGVIIGGAYPALGLPGFSGATALTLTTPAADVGFAVDNVLQVDSTGLVLG
ncbi:MAG: baseplate J/gp47 family protein [Byssovorax sp.]